MDKQDRENNLLKVQKERNVTIVPTNAITHAYKSTFGWNVEGLLSYHPPTDISVFFLSLED